MRDLAEIDRRHATRYGAKAAMLGEMAAAGLPVPWGFAVPTAGFDAFLRAAAFPWQAADFAAAGAAIRAALATRSLPAALAAGVRARLQELRRRHGDGPLMVRTSALAEDRPEASLAGLFRSCGPLTDDDDVLAAIADCYRSLFADAVLDRLAAGAIAPGQFGAGVIIQGFVAGDISGVTFTADPVTGDPHRLRLTAAVGPCRGVTDGTAPACTWTVGKEDGQVLRVAGTPPAGATEWLQEWAAAAGIIERLAGAHQDIEWTVASGRLCILQSRPLTAFRSAVAPSPWVLPEGADPTQTWRLRSERCLPPLLAEIVAAAVRASGDGAYRHGMGWDSITCLDLHGYLYEAPRPIADGQARLDAYLAVLNEQFDRGSGEFAEHIEPELRARVADLENRYLRTDLPGDRLASYLDDAENYLYRALSLHWRATTSEWYLGHFFRQRLEPWLPGASVQDLVDLVHGTTWMVAERELLYAMAAAVRACPAVARLFASCPYDSLVAARLERENEPTAVQLVADLRAYAQRYGWVHGVDCETGAIRRGGQLPLAECVGRLRRYLHVDLAEYQRNRAAVQANRERLRALALSRCRTEEETARFGAALRAGEKAFLAGDDHANLICSRRYVYIADALVRIGEELVARGCLGTAEDIVFCTLAEVRQALAGGDPSPAVGARRAAHVAWQRVLPPRHLGRVPDPGGEGAAAAGPAGAALSIRGESGTRRNTRGRLHLGFPAPAAGDGLVLLLEHGHEGDLSTVLTQVNGLIFKSGTPACHMGILARELGLPAVYGVGPAATGLRAGDEVEIRGDTGEVAVLAAAATVSQPVDA